MTCRGGRAARRSWIKAFISLLSYRGLAWTSGMKWQKNPGGRWCRHSGKEGSVAFLDQVAQALGSGLHRCAHRCPASLLARRQPAETAGQPGKAAIDGRRTIDRSPGAPDGRSQPVVPGALAPHGRVRLRFGEGFLTQADEQFGNGNL